MMRERKCDFSFWSSHHVLLTFDFHYQSISCHWFSLNIDFTESSILLMAHTGIMNFFWIICMYMYHKSPIITHLKITFLNVHSNNHLSMFWECIQAWPPNNFYLPCGTSLTIPNCQGWLWRWSFPFIVNRCVYLCLGSRNFLSSSADRVPALPSQISFPALKRSSSWRLTRSCSSRALTSSSRLKSLYEIFRVAPW